ELLVTQRFRPEAGALVGGGDSSQGSGADRCGGARSAAELAGRLGRAGREAAPRELAQGALVEARHARGSARRAPEASAPDQPPEPARSEQASRGDEPELAAPVLR